MKIGITRVRNEEQIIKSTLDRLSNHLDAVVVFDDASNDDTVNICMDHELVIDILENNYWAESPMVRHQLETTQRNHLYHHVKNKYQPDWVLYFDADEHIYFDDVDWAGDRPYFFRLFDVYITEEDKDKHFMERDWIGCEYRDIPMLFRPNMCSRFYNRVPLGLTGAVMGGTVKHFGKGISIDHWEETCDYYINHLYEIGATGESISDKWRKRKGKAIHTQSDFGNPLIHWRERYQEDKIMLLTQ